MSVNNVSIEAIYSILLVLMLIVLAIAIRESRRVEKERSSKAGES